jgi:hypothetical protein
VVVGVQGGYRRRTWERAGELTGAEARGRIGSRRPAGWDHIGYAVWRADVPIGLRDIDRRITTNRCT